MIAATRRRIWGGPDANPPARRTGRARVAHRLHISHTRIGRLCAPPLPFCLLACLFASAHCRALAGVQLGEAATAVPSATSYAHRLRGVKDVPGPCCWVIPGYGSRFGCVRSLQVWAAGRAARPLVLRTIARTRNAWTRPALSGRASSPRGSRTAPTAGITYAIT